MGAAAAFAGMLGLVVGSFLNVVIHRLPAGESIVSPGSRCPSCGTAVAAYDNLPVVSWVLLRGACRRCGEGISARYPIVELLTGAAFAAVVAVRGVSDDLALLLPFAAVLVVAAAIDLDHRIIPNRIMLPTAVYALAVTPIARGDDILELAIAGTAAFGLLLLTALVHPAGMGMGDVKLAGVMGLYLGASVAPALVVAFLAGSVVGIAMIARRGAAARKEGIPFGPFLALGGLVGLLAGPELIDLYVSRFL